MPGPARTRCRRRRGSNVDVTITVTDELTGQATSYANPVGTPLQPIQDTAAFATCE